MSGYGSSETRGAFRAVKWVYLPSEKKQKPLHCVQLFVIPCSLPGSSVHGSLQAKILEWVAIPYSRGSS